MNDYQSKDYGKMMNERQNANQKAKNEQTNKATNKATNKVTDGKSMNRNAMDNRGANDCRSEKSGSQNCTD